MRENIATICIAAIVFAANLTAHAKQSEVNGYTPEYTVVEAKLALQADGYLNVQPALAVTEGDMLHYIMDTCTQDGTPLRLRVDSATLEAEPQPHAASKEAQAECACVAGFECLEPKF